MILFLENLLERFVLGVPRTRRGRYRPRIDESLNRKRIEELRKEYEQEIALQAEELASIRTEIEIAKYQAQGEDRKARLAELESKVLAAEETIAQLRDEEDFIVVLAFAL